MENKKIKIILKDKGNLLANATVLISSYDYGNITIKNFQIWKSRIFNSRLDDNINIQPPGLKYFSNFSSHVFLEDKQHWYELEREIFLAYLDKRNENEDLNMEDINI